MEMHISTLPGALDRLRVEHYPFTGRGQDPRITAIVRKL